MFSSKSGATVNRVPLGVLRPAFQNLKRDLEATAWLRGLGWYAVLIWFFGLIASAMIVGLMSHLVSTDSACPPDGEFTLYPNRYSMWSSTGYFQITLAGGNLTFATAKLIDIMWDVGVGRGGQLLLAMISWREFAKYLTICMENEPVTYQVFRTIFIGNEASLLSSYRTITSFIRQRRLRSRVAMIFMAVTMVFILAFPTLMSAMSGYEANVSSHVKIRDNTYVPFKNFSRAFYYIEDAQRIRDANRTIEDPWITSSYENGEEPVLGRGRFDTIYGPIRNHEVPKYVSEYGLDGRYENKSKYAGANLTAPSLKIKAYTLQDTALPAYNTFGANDAAWMKDEELFTKQYIEEHGRCQSTGDYKWGFSFLQLFICIVLLIAWTAGIYIMWIYTHYTLGLRRRHAEEVAGEHRAILELAAAMRSELEIEDLDFSLLREKQLKERIAKEIQGGTVNYAYADSTPEWHSIRKGLAAWFKIDKRPLVSIFLTTAFCSMFWMTWYFPRRNLRAEQALSWLWHWMFSLWFGQIFALTIGTTPGSRLLIILICGFLGSIVVGGIAGSEIARYQEYYSNFH